MRYYPKEIPISTWSPGQNQAQVVAKIKDVEGALKEVVEVLRSLRVDLKQEVAHAVPGKGYAIFNAFVELKDPAVTPKEVVKELERSPSVIKAHCAAGRQGGIVDTMAFPVTWEGRRVTVLFQDGLAELFQDIQTSFGTGGDAILYKGGTVYGRRYMSNLVQAVGVDVMRKNADYAMELLGAAGIGVPESVKVDTTTGASTVRIYRCFECEDRRALKPMCSFLRGTLVGAAEVLLVADFECIETECTATGKEYCEFALVPKAKTQGLMPWQIEESVWQP